MPNWVNHHLHWYDGKDLTFFGVASDDWIYMQRSLAEL
jgi:hypothetical protein